jgi:uncharacterized protein
MSKYTIHLGVTGLRRTGKTVFLTSLIYQLRERGSRELASFGARSIELLPAEMTTTTGCGKFPFEAVVADLRREPPAWPQPTYTEYQATLVTPFRQNRARRPFRFLPPSMRNGFRTHSGTIELHIHDYPGEYLLDVELSRVSFDQWSQTTIERMKVQCPTEAQRYCQVLDETATTAFDEIEASLSRLRAAYAAYVAAAHADHFEMIQPGIALLSWTRNLPSNSGSADPGQHILPFIPVPPPAGTDKLEELRQIMRESYVRYVEKNVKPFIQSLDASHIQLVLVDVLRILSNGLACYNDTRMCLESTLTAYQYAGTWFGSRVRQVIFAATKADHALNGHRPNLARLLETLVERARGRIGGRLLPRYRWVASLRATEDAVDRRNGRPQEVLRGTLVNEEEQSVWNPGPVPSEWPDRLIPFTSETWNVGNDFYQFPRFAPPRFPARDGAPIPHLNLDELLRDVLESCFSDQVRGSIHGRP